MTDKEQSLREENQNMKKQIRQLSVLLDTCRRTLKLVASGIWRDKKRNACGLTGHGAHVSEVERTLEEIRKFIEDED